MRAEVSRNESPSAASLRLLLNRLTTRKVLNWSDSNTEDDGKMPREVALDQANIVTSRHATTDRHALLLDIDYPAWLVKSSTPGHFHLYLDVPGGIPHEKYFALLGTLADCGVIERGYERTSRLRGFSSLRLPWIRKEGS